MRILFFANDFPSPWAPTKGTFNFELVRSLARQHDVQVVVPIPWVDEVRCSLQIPRDVSRNRTETRDGLAVHYPRYSYTPKLARYWYDCFLWHSVKSTLMRLNDFRPDVVLAYWPYPDGSVAVRYARNIGAAVFVMAGGSGVLIQARDKGWRRDKISRTLSAADGVFAVSADLKQKVIELGIRADRVHLVYRGVDRERFTPGDKRLAREKLGLPFDVPLFLFVGRLVPVKGLEVLLAAAAILRRNGTSFQLILAGEGSERRRLEAIVAAEGLAQSVRFVGNTPHELLPQWYRAADWTVLTSHSEGVPNVLIESHACGTPFIATRVGGISEISVAGCDRLVARGDSIGLAEQMQAGLQSPPLDSQLLAGRVSGLADAASRFAEIMQREVDLSDGSSALTWDRRVSDTGPPGSDPRATIHAPSDRIQCGTAGVPAVNYTLSRPNPWRQFVRRTLAATLPRKLLLTNGPRDCGQVCLTFDDGPHPEHTPRLLDVLADLRVKATFFVIGDRAARYPEIVRRIAEEGHVLGGHSWSHRMTEQLLPKFYTAEIRRTIEFLSETVGRPVKLFRPPRGKLTARQLLTLWRLGQSVVLWNVDSKDYNCQTAEDLTASMNGYPFHGGDVVLLHDNHPHAAAVMPMIVAGIRERKLSLGTLDAWLPAERPLPRTPVR